MSWVVLNTKNVRQNFLHGSQNEHFFHATKHSPPAVQWATQKMFWKIDESPLLSKKTVCKIHQSLKQLKTNIYIFFVVIEQFQFFQTTTSLKTLFSLKFNNENGVKLQSPMRTYSKTTYAGFSRKKDFIAIVNIFQTINVRQMKQERLERVDFENSYTYTQSFKHPV